MEVQVIMESIVDIKQEEDSFCDDSIKIESASSSEADTRIQKSRKREMTKSIQDQSQIEKTVIQCPLCSQSFARSSTTNFINHLQENHAANNNVAKNNQDKHHCPLCSKSFGSKNGLHRHVIITHVEHKPFECQICKSGNKCTHFVKQNSLDKHVTKARRRSQFQCEICLETFKGSFFFEIHKKSHLKVVSDIKCQFCFKPFTTQRVLNRHLLVQHKVPNPKVKTYTCELCGKIYFRLFLLQMHVADAHVVDKSVKCPTCGKMFLDETHLAHHETHVHKARRKSFKCDVCSHEFNRRMYFVRHLGVKHERFFSCDECSTSFGTKADFDQHSAVVSDSQELQCHICRVVLQSRCSFNIHTQSHAKQLNPETKQ